MAKDPAFLFYSSDFFMGTVGMSDAQVGQYIRLMCLQHQQGRLSESVMKAMIGRAVDPAVLAKFSKDEEGLYYNKRLEDETSRRSTYTESRRRNLQKKNGHKEEQNDSGCTPHMDAHMDDHMVEPNTEECARHMEQHMETETETVTIGYVSKKPKKGVKPKKVVTEVDEEHSYGEYGWVKLTGEQYAKLLKDLGPAEFARCLKHVDESAQGNGNRNDWKDWNLTIRKCSRDGWGRKDGKNGWPGQQVAGPGAGGDESAKLHSKFNGTVV